MSVSFETLDPATEAYRTGEAVFRRGSVVLLQQEEDALVLRVGTSPAQQVRLCFHDEPNCTCGEAASCCRHVVAALFYAEEKGILPRLTLRHRYDLGQKMLAALSRAMPDGESVRLSPVLRLYPDGRIGLGLSLGQDRLYAVKSIPELLRCYASGTPLALSVKFAYHPAHMRFAKADERLLTILNSHLSVTPEISLSEEDEPRPIPTDGRYLLLSGAFLQSILRFLETRSFLLLHGEDKQPQSFVRTVELPLCFHVSLSSGELMINAEGAEDLSILTSDARYALYHGHVVHLHSAQARVCALLAAQGRQFCFAARDAEEMLGALLPALSTVGTVSPSPALAARLITAAFSPKAYLDLEGGNVVARLEFCYGDVVLHPFRGYTQDESEPDDSQEPLPDSAGVPEGRLLLRDGRAESALLDFFSDAGFVVRGQRIVLRRAKDILTFCTQGVGELSKRCEVYASSAFEKMKPRRFTGRASFRMSNGRLVFALLEDGRAVPELPAILQAVRDRQQYVRLRTGEFLDIRDMSALSPVAQELLEAAALDDPSADEDARELRFGAYRAAYMVGMLRLAGAKTSADAEVKSAIESLADTATDHACRVPPRLLKKLTPYQRRGVSWLLSLHEARMGGILADEMGLGKTVQLIAALSAAKAKDGPQCSMIVTPTSLIYHWLAELKRFDDALVVRTVMGPRDERARMIDEIKRTGQADVILTSYPLLRRDIARYGEFPLRFAVLDEAQFVKNAHSQGAVAAKELAAQTRIALTGTPMENHTGELWSIFDFVLPGYLGTQSAFYRRYGSGEHAQELQERIRPFLMRRLKSEVLADLPEKREQSLYAAMAPEQEQVYLQLLGTLRLHVDEALRQGSLPRARMQVLSLLLKLRQVCCHPKLLLPDYEGTSGKLELLAQTVHTAIAGRRRILIFSQFVGMLQIIKKRLSREGVKTLYLDGDTKPEMRQELCDRFNAGEGQVFLISLKAGGTGLNLTGADLVIHYDPWWNPATEDQATDRAHRIGQTRDVDVIRLIAQDTIEEKVTDLSKRKRAIFDKVVLAGETALSSLSEEDIRALFF